MTFLSKSECEEWLHDRNRELPTIANTEHHLILWYPPNPADIDFLWLAREMSFRDPVLLWITEWGIWPGSENWHLYDRLRRSYGDFRQLHEAPGHLFQNYEMDDLATFLQLAATNGWGGYLLPHAHYASLFFSHDEYIEFYGSMAGEVEERFAHMLQPPIQFHSSGNGGRHRIRAGEGDELTPAEIHPQASPKKDPML